MGSGRVGHVCSGDNRDTRLIKATSVASDHGKTVMNRGGGYEQVGLRENVCRLPAFFNQQAPRENDIFGNLENPLLKHGPHPLREPLVQLRSANGFRNKFNSESNFSKGNGADLELRKGPIGDKGNNPWLRPWTSQLRQDVGIEQPSHYREASRTGR